MSNKTPRKSRHRHQPSGSGPGPRQIAASDYESDAVQYMESRTEPAVAHRPSRTNTDLNISVLSRYLPGGVRSILSIAASATVYLFSETEGWEKCGVEGTMFVVEREPVVTPSGQSLMQLCVFVLNRRALENLVVDLVKVTDCELADELIIFRLEEDDTQQATDNSPETESAGQAQGGQKVIGIWIHADEEHTREVNHGVIHASWQQARASWNAFVQAVAEEQAQMEDDGGGILLQTPTAGPGEDVAAGAGTGLTAGRRLSITDLFGQRNGNG
ncbi:mRNA-decapping enzyme 1B [Naviculisporaceae sp. PSN 640]